MSDALNRGLDVLELLASRGDSRVGDLMADLGVSRATAHRIMGTLEDRGYVEHVREDHCWRLGPAVSELAVGLDSASLIQVAAPGMADLRATSRETVNLALMQRRRLVWAASFDGAYALRMATTIGEAVSVHSTAAGKAVLSALPEDAWAPLLPAEPYPRLTHTTRTTLTDLRRDVEEARRRGWALDDEECELSGVCVGAPILGRDGRPVGAISVCSVIGRLPADAREGLGLSVKQWCERISAELAGQSAARSPSTALHTA